MPGFITSVLNAGCYIVNDFTKDELEKINYALDITTFHNDEYEENEQLLNKIQSMIENYCEHQSTSDGSGLEQICLDCGKSFNE